MSPTDALLLPFLEAAEESAEVQLAELIASQTDATVKGIVKSQLGVSLRAADGSYDNQEALELVADVQADLLTAFRRLRTEPGGRGVGNLHGYVAATTFNACHQLLRRKHPQRQRLKNKLRYLLTHTEKFALWQGPDWDWRAGIAAWRDRSDAAAPADLQRLRGVLAVKHPAAERDPGRAVLVDLLAGIFDATTMPVLLVDLVTLVVGVLGIQEVAREDRSSAPGVPAASGRVEATAHVSVEQRAGLDALWTVIGQLPLRHRAALLLNLRDPRGGDALALLPHTGVATIEQIARMLEFPQDEFARIWNELPWDDQAIAQHLGLSRQQVINLRQSARARLAREWRGF